MKLDLRGTWVNRDGYSLTFDHNDKGWFGRTKAVYRFKLDPVAPLQWHTADGLILEPCRKTMITDGGSVPWPVTTWIDRLLCPRGFPCHDAAYRAGYCWSVQHDGTAHRLFLERPEVDELLYWQALADGASYAQARAIWAGVRIGGLTIWNGYRRADSAQ